MPDKFIISLDQGTTSSRAVLYDASGKECAIAKRPLAASHPEDGWVEQDAEDIYQSVSQCLEEIATDIDAKQIAAIGITNQRETIVCWDKNSGKALAPAIVWQCRRSAPQCRVLREAGLEETVREKTGLVIDAYFSASKIAWLIENCPEVAAKVADGSAVFGTVDAWVLYRLTSAAGSAVIATEASNASRTMLCNINSGSWDEQLLAEFGIREENLPEIRPSFGNFGLADVAGKKVPITGILGDQQASMYGNACEAKHSAKCTFGTGAFLLLNTGNARPRSNIGLLSTIAWQEQTGERVYAIEGSVFVAGALIQWLRDELEIISSAEQTAELAAAVADNAGVFVVPAFVGLGAPHWDECARGIICGLTRDSSKAHIVRASLEAVAHQVADMLESKEFDELSALRIDGGMSENPVFCQILADIIGREVLVAASAEMTAFGAARAAVKGLNADDLPLEAFALQTLGAKSELQKFSPSRQDIAEQRQHWKRAVERSKLWSVY